MNDFSFKLQTNMKFGAGTAESLPSFLSEQKYGRIGLIADKGIVGIQTYRKIYNLLKSQSYIEHEYINEVSEPAYEDVDRITNEFRNKKIDCLVVFGGGSAMDIAKGVSVLLTNEGPAITYRGYGLVKNPGVPLVALPTTAGSGSEVTPNASFIDTKESKKLGINTSLYLPKLTILDPLLTISCPKLVTVSSGLDALVHTLEAFSGRAATPLARTFAREAFQYIFNSLPQVLNNPADINARGRMQLGAYCAGIALINSASGAAGVLSYPLGVHYKVPHGIAGAVFLAPVARFNIERGYEEYAELHDLIDGADKSLGPKEKNLAFLQEFEKLCELAGIPKSIRELGVKEEDLPLLAQESYINRKKSADQNPIATGVEGLEIILKMAYSK